MNAFHEFERRLSEAWPATLWRDVSVVVAVSGGADSVALLRALRAIGQQQPGCLAVAHYNHRLRGEESEEDERFMRRLCEHLNLPLEVGHAPSVGGGASAGARLSCVGSAISFSAVWPITVPHAMLPWRILPTIRPRRFCTGLCAAPVWPGWPVFRPRGG